MGSRDEQQILLSTACCLQSAASSTLVLSKRSNHFNRFAFLHFTKLAFLRLKHHVVSSWFHHLAAAGWKHVLCGQSYKLPPRGEDRSQGVHRVNGTCPFLPLICDSHVDHHLSSALKPKSGGILPSSTYSPTTSRSLVLHLPTPMFTAPTTTRCVS